MSLTKPYGRVAIKRPIKLGTSICDLLATRQKKTPGLTTCRTSFAAGSFRMMRNRLGPIHRDDRMKKFLLASIAAAAISSASAFAADYPTKAQQYAPFNWSGFYVGVNGGYAWDPKSTMNYSAPATGFAGFSPGFETRGAFGGGQIGFNWQVAHSVFGIEADIQGGNLRDAFNVTTTSNGGALGVIANQKIDYFGTVRARLGMAYDRSMLYATAGVAYGGVKDSILLANNGQTDLLAKNFTGVGYVVGGGWEYYFAPAWSFKAEYQFIDLGHQTISGVSTNAVFITTNNETKFQTARIGLNYKFGSQ
jgi:outer membrane immunogenic protein